METLFSFEVLVEYILIEGDGDISDELCLGLRLLDFPTFLIHKPETKRSQLEYLGNGRKCNFNRGKSCFFKINPDSLHAQLSNTALYAMVLDVKEDIPKLVGTSLISLSKVMSRIKTDVTLHGVSTPSSHGEMGVVSICDLAGQKIGTMSLSYKLTSFGTDLQTHILKNKKLKEKCIGVKLIQQNTEEKVNITREPSSPPIMDKSVHTTIQSSEASTEDVLIQAGEQDILVGATPQKESKLTKQSKDKVPPSSKEPVNSFEEDFAQFCPPKLIYTNTTEDRNKDEAEFHKPTKLDPLPITPDETSSEEQLTEDKVIDQVPPVMKQESGAATFSNQKDANVTVPNVLREALGQLPLLNALLVELSQLNEQGQCQPLSIHPHLAWIYRPSSPDRSAARGISSQTDLPQDPSNVESPHSKPPKSHRDNFPARTRPARDTKSAPIGQPRRRKLVHGTTKTFNLRLKQNAPQGGKREHECVKLIQTLAQSDTPKRGINKSNKPVKCGASSAIVNNSSKLNRVTKTTVGSVSTGPKLKEATSPKHKDKNAGERKLEDENVPQVSKSSSRFNSPIPSAASPSKREWEAEDEEYKDDFNSLNSSEASSPVPASTPKAGARQSPHPPSICDHDPASSSAQRCLMGTHIIRPRSQASVRSISFSEGDRNGPASGQTMCSQKADSSRDSESPGADSLESSRGRDSVSTKNSSPIRDRSASPLDPCDLEEAEDVLGSLDFKNEYQHISQLVANKLPGYTL